MDEAPWSEPEETPELLPAPRPPGGAPAPYVEPPDAMSAETVGKIMHAYVHTDRSVSDISVDLGLSTRDVRTAIRRYGMDKKKAEVITQMQQEELAAYQKFLLENRVSTAEEHRRISQKINKAAEAIVDKAATMPADELLENVKQLKAVAGLFKSLSETLSNSSTVGARAVALGGLSTDQAGGFPLAAVAGKKPLVSLSFNVAAPQPRPQQPEAVEAEYTEET